MKRFVAVLIISMGCYVTPLFAANMFPPPSTTSSGGGEATTYEQLNIHGDIDTDLSNGATASTVPSSQAVVDELPDQGVSTVDIPSFEGLTLTGTGGLRIGVAGLVDGKITLLNSSNANETAIIPGAAVGNLQFTWLSAYPAGDGYIVVVSSGGVLSTINPATIGGGPIVSDTDCSGKTSGGCIDTTTNTFWLWNGSTMAFMGPISSTDLTLTEGSVLIGDSNDKASESALDTDLTTTSANHDTAPSALATKTYADTKALVAVSGSATFDPTSVADGACSAAVDGGTATGVLTTDVIDWTPSGDVSGTTGYNPSGDVGYIWAYPTADHVNFKFCNKSGSAIDPGSITLNWRVVR